MGAGASRRGNDSWLAVLGGGADGGAMKKKAAAKARATAESIDSAVEEALGWLKDASSKKVRDGMVRYAIPSDKALGVPVGEIRKFAKKIGRSPELSRALWETDVYEARLLAVFTGDPGKMTSVEMDRWCADFDSWAVCDTACFHLFDSSPLAFKKIAAWAKKKGEFQKRAAFALLASVTSEDVKADHAKFLNGLKLIEAAADDERNFVKKGVNCALRSVGNRSKALHAEALKVAEKLSRSENASTRWIGKDAVREFHSKATLRRIERRG
jgi:3-methyladenine DNA glycosylase AlkD